MQIKKSTSQKKKILIIIIIAVSAIGGTASALIINHVSKNQTKTSSQQEKKSTKNNSKDDKKSDKQNNSTNSSNTSSNDSNKTDSSNNVPTLDSGDGKEPEQYENQGTANDPANSKVISGGVNNKSIDGNTLSISATMFQNITSGNGVLVLTGPQGQSYTATTDLYNSPSGATMVAFDVPLDKLGSNRSGKWTIKITVDNKDYSGDIEDSINL